MKKGNEPDARDYFERALKLDPNLAMALLSLAQIKSGPGSSEARRLSGVSTSCRANCGIARLACASIAGWATGRAKPSSRRNCAAISGSKQHDLLKAGLNERRTGCREGGRTGPGALLARACRAATQRSQVGTPEVRREIEALEPDDYVVPRHDIQRGMVRGYARLVGMDRVVSEGAERRNIPGHRRDLRPAHSVSDGSKRHAPAYVLSAIALCYRGAHEALPTHAAACASPVPDSALGRRHTEQAPSSGNAWPPRHTRADAAAVKPAQPGAAGIQLDFEGVLGRDQGSRRADPAVAAQFRGNAQGHRRHAAVLRYHRQRGQRPPPIQRRASRSHASCEGRSGAAHPGIA